MKFYRETIIPRFIDIRFPPFFGLYKQNIDTYKT